ncbi:MAG: glycoside hydrolase family 88 protein [Acidobacteria bacterium]|nr:glycoside hydrolase family 88 protein [Acidobacteriota bacterium]
MRVTSLHFGILFLACAATLPAAGMPHKDKWLSVADAVVVTDPARFAYNWGEGVQAIGMMKIHTRSQNDAYSDWVSRWLALYIPLGMDELLKTNGVAANAPDYCGYWSPATASLYLYDMGKKPEHLKLAVDTAEFIEHRAGRGPDGALDHWKDKKQLWVDTLYMACPLLAGLSKRQSKPAYLDDAINQLLLFSKHTQDPKSGLFYHMWDWTTNEHSKELWARGNGWVLMSIADVMEVMKRGDKRYAQLRKVAEAMTEGILKTQNSEGMWHTVMDDRSSYPESSATMMFAYGLLKLHRLKVLPASVKPAATKSWEVVNERYVKDGVVTGVSAGTIPNDRSGYKGVPLGSRSWGTGAYLMAGSEIDRLAR